MQAEAHWALVERVLASQQFRRTVRLRDFLRYVAGKSIAQPGTAVPEQEVGAAVFGRALDYDTGADNIVRVSAGDLRRRLEHYFLDEGAAETVIVEMPRGGYTLSFRERVAVEADLAAVPVPPPGLPSAVEDSAVRGAVTTAEDSAPVVPHTGFLAWLTDARTLVLGALCVVLAAACGYFLLRTSREPWQSAAPLRSVWAPFLGSDAKTEIVLADSSFAILRRITGAAVTLPDYLNYRYRETVRDAHLDPATQAAVDALLARNTGSIGEFEAARGILALTHQPARLVLGSAHDFTPASIKSNNVVLLGGSPSNPWVELYRAQRTLFIEQGPSDRTAVVRNLDVHAGEQALYRLEGNSDDASGYAVVAILPNIDPDKRVMIVEGTDSQATLAASNFITTPAGAETLAAYLQGGTVPQQMEVLLKSSKLLATALKANILLVHTSRSGKSL